MAKFNTGVSFTDGSTVTGADLNNITSQLNIYTGVISEQTAMSATVSTADQLLIADTDNGDSGAANRVTIQKLLNDTLTNGTYTNAQLSGNLNVVQLSTLGTISSTRGTIGILNSTTGTIASLNTTTGTIPTLTAGTTTSTAANITNGTVQTLTASTGTIGTFNSTTGTIGTINSTTGTITNLSTTLAGDFTISQGTGTLGTTAVTAGSYGSVSAIPFITVDAKGRITSATTGTFSTTPADGSITPAKLSQPFTSATVTASTSGTAIDFTSIPSWAKRVSVLFNKVGITGTSNMLVQLGTSGGIQATNYEAQASVVNASVATLNSTTGFPIRNVEAAARISGIMTIATLGSNLWVMSGTLTVIGGVASVEMVAGVIQLSGVLDKVRINALAAETFDEGSLNIMYEG